MEKMTIKEFAERIGSNRWHWGLREFAERLGIEGEYAKEKFFQFRDLADALREFDAETLEKLAAPREQVSPACGEG